MSPVTRCSRSQPAEGVACAVHAMDADSQQETVRFHRAITGPSNDTYGLIATDSKTQTVAEAARMFTRRLCASPPHSDFSRKSGKRMLWESELAGCVAVRATRHCRKRCGRLLGGAWRTWDQQELVDDGTTIPLIIPGSCPSISVLGTWPPISAPCGGLPGQVDVRPPLFRPLE